MFWCEMFVLNVSYVIDLPADENASLPSLVDEKHSPSYCLKSVGRSSIARILSCLSYNSPDVTFCPLIYPICAALRHYLSEEDSYGFIANLLASRSVKYLAQVQSQVESEWRTLKALNQKNNVRLVK